MANKLLANTNFSQQVLYFDCPNNIARSLKYPLQEIYLHNWVMAATVNLILVPVTFFCQFINSHCIT